MIMVHSPDRTLFDQAIFILSDDAVRRDGVTDEKLMREANRLLKSGGTGVQKQVLWQKVAYFFAGAMAMGLLWLITAFS